MKKVLIVIGIIVLIAGIVSFVIGGWYHHLYMSVMDGDADLFDRIRRSYTTAFLCGAGLDIAGIILIIICICIKK